MLYLIMVLLPLGFPPSLRVLHGRFPPLFCCVVLLQPAGRALWQPALIFAAMAALAVLARVIVVGLHALERTVLAAGLHGLFEGR